MTRGQILYCIVASLSYIGYVALDSYRLSNSSYWLSKQSLTAQDIHIINRFGSWIVNIESLFVTIFIAALVFYFIKKKIRRFIATNVFFLSGIAIIGLLFSFLTPYPLGNAWQPLFLPLFILLVVSIYAVIKFRFMKKGTE